MVFEETTKQGIKSFLLNAEVSRNCGGAGMGTTHVVQGRDFKTPLLTPGSVLGLMPLLLQHKLEKKKPNYCGFVEPEFQL